MGYGHLYIGTTDGRVIAIDTKTGKSAWDTQVTEPEELKSFTGAPVVVKDKVIIGATGGEYSGCCGPIYALDAKTGKVAWRFDVVGSDERSRASWGK